MHVIKLGEPLQACGKNISQTASVSNFDIQANVEDVQDSKNQRCFRQNSQI